MGYISIEAIVEGVRKAGTTDFDKVALRTCLKVVRL
jgi:hypothetical protein